MVVNKDGKVVGKVDTGGQVGCWSSEEMEPPLPRWAVNRTKEATGKHGRSKHSAPCLPLHCILGNTAYCLTACW